MKRILMFLAVLALSASACSSSESRSDVLGDFAERQILPAYQEAANKAADLEKNIITTCNEKRLSPLVQTSLVSARHAWAATEAMWLGPVMDERLASRVDYEIDPPAIDALIQDTSKRVDAQSIASRAANQRGYAAIDYVTGKYPVTDARVCEYITSLGQLARTATTDASNAWNSEYKQTFADDADKSIDSLVNDSIVLLQKVSDMEIGTALGRNNNPGKPEAIPELSGGDGVAFERARLNSLRAVTNGLAPLLDETLNQRLQQAFAEADNALNEIDGPLRAAVVSDRADVEKAKAALDELRRIESTEVVSKLGVTVGFSDSDGDSAG